MAPPDSSQALTSTHPTPGAAWGLHQATHPQAPMLWLVGEPERSFSNQALQGPGRIW